jgi:GNAT superfamily N-acetyltransferase
MRDSHDSTRGGLARTLDVRPVGLDDLSAVRYVHVSAMRKLGAGRYSPAELDAFQAHVYSTRYVDLLLGDVLLTGWLGGELVATSGWALPLERDDAARIRAVFVQPLFTGLGIGQRMLEEAEARARKSGFSEFAVRATLNAMGFFEAAGYEVTSHGSRMLQGAVSIPVAFMRKSDEDAISPVTPSGRA